MGVSQSLDVSGIGHEHDILVMAVGAGDTPAILGNVTAILRLHVASSITPGTGQTVDIGALGPWWY
jgi:hypothetical protein